MNKEFSYYMNNINEAIEEDEDLKIVFDKHKGEILIKIKEHYEKYKNNYEFDDLLNVNSTHCTLENSICCNGCYCCIYCILCSNCDGCKSCYNCSNCDGCEWCYNSTNCDHCGGCENCENCKNCIGCEFCKDCKDCDNCQHLENCDTYLENYEYKSEENSEDN